MDFIQIPATLGIVFFFTYKMFELYARRRERIMLIEKLSAEELNGNINLGELNVNVSPFGALKGGCLLSGLGLGLLVGYIIATLTIPENIEPYQYKQLGSVIYGSCVLLFGGISLIIAFVIEIKLGKDRKA